MSKHIKKLNNKSKRTSPLVSVVIPVFNGAGYLEEAVESVQRSFYRTFEVLLIDDGSTDKSRDICRRLTEKYKNVRFFDMKVNRGLGRVLNFALKNARGTYIARLNQDDRMLPHRLQTQVNFLEKHPETTAVGSTIRLFDNQGHTQIVRFLANDEDIKRMWYIVSPFSDPSVMYRKDVAIAAGGYDQEFWPADDTHLWYRMGMRGKLANIQKPLVEVRWHDGAASVRFFRRLALKTFQMHQWTHENVHAAGWLVQFYWIVQLIAGYTLSPQTNWNIYRKLKKLIAYADDRRKRLAEITAKMPVPMVTIHPRKLSVSGL